VATTVITYAGLADGAAAGHSHFGAGASAVASGKLVTSGLSGSDRGGATLDVSAPSSSTRVRGRLSLVTVGSGTGPIPAGGLVLRYTESPFAGFRILCGYAHAAISVNANLRLSVSGSHTGDSLLADEAWLTGHFLSVGEVIVLEARYTPGAGGAIGLLEYRVWVEGAAVPAYHSVSVHPTYAGVSGPGGLMDVAGESLDSNTRWHSLEVEYPSFAAPAVTVSGIGHTTATLSGSAPVHPTTGATHVATTWWVERESDGEVLYGPVRVDSGSLVGPQLATGLPLGETGLVAKAQCEDQLGVLSDAGTSDSFDTLGPPNAPTVAVSEIRRTRVKVTPSAYSHPQGAPQGVRRARVRRLSTNTLVVPATAVALSGTFYLDGLPEGPEGDGGRPAVDADLVVEVQDEDDAVAGEWGVSGAFQTLNLWESGEFLVHVDVLIERPSGEATVLQSYRDFGGVNWIRKLSLRLAGVDQQIGAGELTLHRQVGELSLALLNTTSALNQDGGAFAPALSFGRELEVRVSLQRPDADEAEWGSWTWVTIFRGLTDDPAWPRKTGDVSVPFRDRSGALAERLVRDELAFGSADGIAIEDVAQQLLDQTMGAGQYTIVAVPSSPGYLVRDYRVKDVMVWQGLDTLASVIGATFRQLETTEGAVLALVLPPRGKTEADYTVTPSTYLENTQLATDGKNLRTVVVGRAVDKSTGEILTSQLPAEADVETDPLVLQYGDRTLSFNEDDKSPVDTQEELDGMVVGIYADVSSPPIPLEMETKLAPFAAVDDLVRWGANTVLWDQDLDGAVLVLSHEFPSPGVGRTVWRCAGKPKGKYAAWLLKAVEIAGIGAVPAISDVVITHDPPGLLNLSLRVNRDTVRWAGWDRIGAPPIGDDGIPIEACSVGEYSRETRTASWTVVNGTHEILVRAINRDGHFVHQLLTYEVTGAGSSDDGHPTEVPGTPQVFRGAVTGDVQDVDTEWVNTSTSYDVQVEYFVSGESMGVLDLAAGAATDTRSWPVGSRVACRARYTAGAGLDGEWSPTSPQVFLPGALP
jgi:hypothetical protein